VQDGWYALYWAARQGHTEIVEALLAAGAAVNVQANARLPTLLEPSHRVNRTVGAGVAMGRVTTAAAVLSGVTWLH
jgi:ankyrin repeat protein